MATPNASSPAIDDPFSTPTPTQRFLNLDGNANILTRDQSPSQVKRALETHLEETAKRLDIVGDLGNRLLNQKNALSERLKEVEGENGEELNPELKQKLVDLEKEYNEVGRESARAFLTTKTSLGGAMGSASTFGLVRHPFSSPFFDFDAT